MGEVPWERSGVRTWDFGELPAEATVRSGALRLRAYPGIQDDGSSVRLRLFTSESAARRATRDGLLRLAALAMPQQHELVRRQLAGDREFTLLVAASGFGKELLAEIADRAVAEAVFGLHARPAQPADDGREHGHARSDGYPVTRREFEALVERGRGEVVDRGMEIVRVVRAVLVARKDARTLLGAMPGPVFAPVRTAVIRQVESLVAPGWVRNTPAGWWTQLPKYMRAVVRRLERARGDVERDRRLQAQVDRYEAEVHRLEAAADPDTAAAERQRLRWMLEEFRLSLFAQDLKTLLPVSAKRLDEQLQLALREARGLVPAPAESRRGRS
jgi:ATP-dependent helicase HrpA